MKTVRQKILGVLAPVFVFALLFGFWQWICVANEIPKWLLPSPANIFVCMVENFSEFGTHFLISFITVLSGFLLAVPLGVLLATGITSSKTLSAALSPYIIVLVTTPLIIILPLLMLFLGYGIKVRTPTSLSATISTTPRWKPSWTPSTWRRFPAGTPPSNYGRRFPGRARSSGDLQRQEPW